MDRTVPAGAAILLAFIRATETGREDASAYRTIYGHNERKLPQPITTMTLGEIIDAQSNSTRRFKSSACGAYQFMRATLLDLSRELGLRGDQVFEPDLQDRLAYHLLKRRGYEAFMAGTIDLVEFGKRLAMEWASLPVLSACRGAHRSLQRGQSYYAGDALNRALVSPERVTAVIRQAYEAEHAPAEKPVAGDPAPRPGPQPAAPVPVAVGKDHAVAAVIGAGLIGTVALAWTSIVDAFHSFLNLIWS